jgi:hypothetical protein
MTLLSTVHGVRTRVTHRLEIELDGRGNGWTDVTRDVSLSYGIRCHYGLQGNGPNDRCAQAGTLQWAMINSHANSAGLVGFYSRMHLNRRAGWELGIRVRWTLFHAGVPYVKHVGTLDGADPASGRLGSRIVDCTSVDVMDDLARAKLTGIPIQLDQRADELLETVLATMVNPPETSFDEGAEVFPYALDSAQDETTTVSEEIARIVASEPGYLYVRGDGVVRFESRASRPGTAVSKYVFNGLAAVVNASYSRRAAPNRVQVTVHPRSIDENYSILYALGDIPFVAAGETLTIQGPFTDSSTAGARVGAVDVQVPLVAGLDYAMSIVPALVSGTADTAFTIRPTGQGLDDASWTGSIADLADQDDGTGVVPNAIAWQSYLTDDVPGAANAAVTNVELVAHVAHNDTPDHFTNWYPQLRYGVLTSRPGIITTYTFGVNIITQSFPTPPGGGDWTVGVLNEIEIGGTFNWDAAVPGLQELYLRGLRASSVATTDRTDDFAVVTTASANAATFEITNNGTGGAYVTKLQIRGRIVTTYEPITVEALNSADIAIRGENVERMNLPYMTSSATGAIIADYYAYLYPATAPFNVDSILVRPNLDVELMAQTISLEIGDRIGLEESVTGARTASPIGGASTLGYHINTVSLSYGLGGILEAEFGLAPADPQPYWLIGVEGFSEIEETTVIGPM